MNLQVVTGRPFVVNCIKCNRPSWMGDVTAFDDKGATKHIGGFADLTGEPFKAYYCHECGESR